MTILAERAIRSPEPDRRGGHRAIESSPLDRVEIAIEDISHGTLTGTVINDVLGELDEVLIAVGRRPIDIVPVVLEPTSAERSFAFDLRFLPPDLLLDDYLQVEVRPRQQPTRLLARCAIETAKIVPFDALPAGQGRLEGYIDAVNAEVVRGWVRDPAEDGRRIKLHLFVDGTFRGIFEAANARPDLAASGRGDGGYGFAISTSELFEKAASADPRVEVVSIEPEFWRVPLAPHMRRRRQAIPRIRDVPQTTRELVALLASNEPLPKKVFALDRLTRMPDVFSADYLGLGLEFLRVELVKTEETAHRTLGDRLRFRLRKRMIQHQIARLTSLVDAVVASQKIMERALRTDRAFGLVEAQDDSRQARRL